MPRLTSDGSEWIPTASRTLDEASHSVRGQTENGVAPRSYFIDGPWHRKVMLGEACLNDASNGRIVIAALGGYYQMRDVIDDEVVHNQHAYQGDYILTWHDDPDVAATWRKKDGTV